MAMIRIYGMHTCPDCEFVEEQVKGNDRFEVIDIGEHVRNLKEFLRVRESHGEVFAAVKVAGAVGIPCFVLEDGRVTLSPEEVGLQSRESVAASGTNSELGTDSGSGSDEFTAGAACRLDGSGC